MAVPIYRMVTVSKIYVTTNTGFSFKEKKHKVKAKDEFRSLPLEDIRHATQYVYSVRNLGDADAEVKVQVGPHGESLTDDGGSELIPAQQTKIITPLHFSKYIRLLYRTIEPKMTTKLVIVFQAQIQK